MTYLFNGFGNKGSRKRAIYVDISCRHCGQGVEIDDLLASANRPCPHCGKPLFGDETPVRRAGPILRFFQGITNFTNRLIGPRIVINRYDALKAPPMVCCACGRPAARPVEEAVLVQTRSGMNPKFFHVLIPYCEEHRRKRRRINIAAYLFLAVLFAPTILLPLMHGWVDTWPVHPVQIWIGFVVLGSIPVWLYAGTGTGVRFMAYDEENVEVRGACPAFIRAFQEQQARQFADV